MHRKEAKLLKIKQEMSLCITKSNKFKHLKSKLLRITYLSIKLRKFGILKILPYVSNLRQKDNSKEIQKSKFIILKDTKIEVYNPKRYDLHPYHFII